MKKSQLVGAFRAYGARYNGSDRSRRTLAAYIAYWIEKADIDQDDSRVEDYLPQFLIGAFDELLNLGDEVIVSFRQAFETDAGYPFPDLTGLGAGNDFYQMMTIESIGSLVAEVTERPHLLTEINALFSAERWLVHQRFYHFLNRVYRSGLADIIAEHPQAQMSGQFGETTLHSVQAIGKLLLSFSRANSSEQTEQVMSFACSDNDKLGRDGGLLSCRVDLQTMLDMLEDVMANWPADRAAQREMYTI